MLTSSFPLLPGSNGILVNLARESCERSRMYVCSRCSNLPSPVELIHLSLRRRTPDLFAAYCICRLLFALFNLFILPRVTSTASLSTLMSDTGKPDVVGSGVAAHQPHSDWISFLVATALSHLPFDIDVAVWSRQISLGMVGVIIGASIQYVMRWVAKALKVGSASVGGVVLLLGLGQLMVRWIRSFFASLLLTLAYPSTPPFADTLPPLPPHPTPNLAPSRSRLSRLPLPILCFRRQPPRLNPPFLHSFQLPLRLFLPHRSNYNARHQLHRRENKSSRRGSRDLEDGGRLISSLALLFVLIAFHYIIDVSEAFFCFFWDSGGRFRGVEKRNASLLDS